MPKSVLSWASKRLKILILFFSVSLIHLYPILKTFFTKLPYATNGDVRLSLAILFAHVGKLAQLHFDQIYHLPFLFPLSNTLTIGFTLFGQAILLLPFFLFGEPNTYALYNGITIFSYLAAGYGAYLFFKELQESEIVAIVTACLYILLPFRVYNIPHLNLLMNFPIPFSFYFLLKYLQTGHGKNLLFFNVYLLFQFLFDLSLGFFLSIALAFFFLFYVIAKHTLQLRSLIMLLLSLLPSMGIVLFIHFPFLQKSVSLSPFEQSFNAAQYHPALSFFAAKSSLLLLMNRIWDLWPFFPGFAVIFFYFYAFSSHVANLRERVLLGCAAGAYAGPGLLAVVFYDPAALAKINSIAEICLLIFWCSMAALIFSLRKKIPLALKSVSWLLLAVVFITFNPFPKFFDFFNALTGIFPFLHRSRGLRTSYILPLAILGIFACGFRDFLNKKQNKKFYLWIAVLIMLLEHFRWPVAMARLPEPSSEVKKIYRLLDRYPEHFGILELPFVPTSSNLYSYFSRYHGKHTYHGHYLVYDDPLGLEDEESLRVEAGLSGLKRPELIDKLKANGLYLIVISGSFIGYVFDGSVPCAWRSIKQNVKAGEELGLFREIKEESHSILIVLDDSRNGLDINYPMPYFSLGKKSQIQFEIQARRPTHSRIFFNGSLLTERDFPPGTHKTSLDIRSRQLKKQLNHIRFLSDQDVTVQNLFGE